MKTPSFILCLAASIAATTVHANTWEEPFQKKDFSLLQLAANKGIDCAFKVIQDKTSFYNTSENSGHAGKVDVKEYDEVRLHIYPSEVEADRYEARYDETRWILPKKIRIAEPDLSDASDRLKASAGAPQDGAHFTIPSLTLDEHWGTFYLENEKAKVRIVGPTIDVATGATPEEVFNIYRNNHDIGIGPLGGWGYATRLSGRKFIRKNGGIDLGNSWDGLHSGGAIFANLMAGWASATVSIYATAAWHNMSQTLQSGSCSASE
jgi:hypothetical protein